MFWFEPFEKSYTVGKKLKMKPLVTNKLVLMWLCSHPAEKSTVKWKKIAYVAFTAFSLLGLLSLIGLTSIFCVQSFSTDLEESLYAIFQMTGSSAMFYFSIVAFNSRHKIAALFENLSDIYSASNFFLTIFNYLKKKKGNSSNSIQWNKFVCNNFTVIVVEGSKIHSFTY